MSDLIIEAEETFGKASRRLSYYLATLRENNPGGLTELNKRQREIIGEMLRNRYRAERRLSELKEGQ